jgi:hypothetical protein
MYDILKQAYENKFLTSLYTNRNDYCKFNVGYVLNVSDNWCLLKLISPHGEFDGYSVRTIDDVYRLEIDGLYINKIETLYKHKIYRGKEIPEINSSGDILLDAIDYAFINKLIVIICIGEDASDIFGYIEYYDNNKIKILQMTDYGQKNGETIFGINEIRRMNINDMDCMDLEILYRNRYFNELN